MHNCLFCRDLLYSRDESHVSLILAQPKYNMYFSSDFYVWECDIMRGVVLVIVVVVFISTQAVEYRHQEHDSWEKGDMKALFAMHTTVIEEFTHLPTARFNR